MKPLVCCVKVKPAYGPTHVNRLAAMLARNTTRQHDFLCLTDDPTGINIPYTDVGTDLKGWWAKLVLFRPHPALVGRRVIYLDLDTVIMGDADFLFDYDGQLAMLRSFLPPSKYGSAIMSFQAGFGREIWTEFHRRPQNIMERLYGDQDWIEENLKAVDLWQDIAPGKIGSYKVDHLEGEPGGFSVCCFHGRPKIEEVDGWVREAWR